MDKSTEKHLVPPPVLFPDPRPVRFDGVLSVEYEDPVRGGTGDRVLTGLLVAHRSLHALLVA